MAPTSSQTLWCVMVLASMPFIDAQNNVYYAEAMSMPLSLNYTDEGGHATLIWNYYEAEALTPYPLTTCTLPDGPCDLGNGNANYYIVPSRPYFNLEIRSVNQATSTKYTAQPIQPTGQTIDYYVIGLDPLSCPDSGTEVDEGTQVEITCISQYYQYQRDSTKIVEPILEWTNDLGTDFNPDAERNFTATSALYTINVTMTAEYDDVPFTCNLTLPADKGLEYYEDSCQVSYYVLHAVSSVDPGLNSTEEIPYVPYGTFINCSSNGRPEPTINWLNENGEIVSDTYALLVTQEMQQLSQPVTFTCRSSNPYNGMVNFVTANVTFYVGNPQIVQSGGGVEAWVIAVAVVVPVVVIAAAAIGGYFFYRHRKNKKAKKSKANGTNGNTRNSNSNYTPVSTVQDPYPPRQTATSYATNQYTAPTAAARTMTPAGSGANSPAGAGGYGALGVQYYTGSNNALNASINSNAPSTQPAYPYNPRQGAPGVNMNPNPNARPNPVPPAGNPTYPYTGRQPSVASSVSSRGPSYHPSQAPPGPHNFAAQISYASSRSGSEV